MKEGDLMNEFKELDVLENTDDTVKERLAEEFPPQDTDEKERVFRMSERKYNIKKNNGADNNFVGEDTVKGVEIYKRPKWKIFASIAACAAIVAGIGGGGYMLKNMNNSKPALTSSASETEPQSSAEAEKTIAPFGDFSVLDYYVPLDDPEKCDDVYLNENDDAPVLKLMHGKSIEQEKRDKLAEFFNSYTWEEYTEPDAEPQEISVEDESIMFLYRDDTEIRMIQIAANNVLAYSHFDYLTDENGKLIKVNYGEMNETSIPCELYKADYELFRKTIDEILADEETQPENEDTNVENAGVENENYETIVQTFEKYDFNLQNITSDADYLTKRDIKMVIPDSDGEQISLVCGTALSADKKERIDSVINNTEWTDMTADEFEEYAEKNTAVDEYFTNNFSFINVTGGDIITMNISMNRVDMCLYECDYDEENDIYYIKNQRSYEMYTQSPTLMKDIYDILNSEEATNAGDGDTRNYIEYTVDVPEGFSGRYVIDLYIKCAYEDVVISSPVFLVPENDQISIKVHNPVKPSVGPYPVTAVLTNLGNDKRADIGEYQFDFDNHTVTADAPGNNEVQAAFEAVQ